MKRVFIQERDRKLIQLAYEHQFVSTNQIRKFLFKNVHMSECYRRLKELEQSGFITRTAPITAGTGAYVRVTPDGASVARGLSIHEVPQNRLNLYSIAHDMLVIEARMRLLEIWNDALWIPEQTIKREWAPSKLCYEEEPQYPDGIVECANGTRVAIELENAAKGKERYRQIFKKWSRSDKVNYVLYVVTSDSIKKTIMSCMNEYESMNGLVVLFNELLSSNKPEVLNQSGKLFHLKPYKGGG